MAIGTFWDRDCLLRLCHICHAIHIRKALDITSTEPVKEHVKRVSQVLEAEIGRRIGIGNSKLGPLSPSTKKCCELECAIASSILPLDPFDTSKYASENFLTIIKITQYAITSADNRITHPLLAFHSTACIGTSIEHTSSSEMVF